MRYQRIFLILLLASSFIVISCSQKANCSDWRQVAQFTGQGTQEYDTMEFRINGSEWRITWSYNPNSIEPSLTEFSFFIFRHGDANPMPEHVYASGSTNTSSVLYIHQGPGLYYLKILTANTAGHTITVEYDKESEVSTGLLITIIALVISIPVIIMIIIIRFVRKKHSKKPPFTTNIPPPPRPPPP